MAAAVNFPDTPTVGQVFATNGLRYQWDGVKWVTYPPLGGIGPGPGVGGGVTEVVAGAGLVGSPNPIVDTGIITLGIPIPINFGGTGAVNLIEAQANLGITSGGLGGPFLPLDGGIMNGPLILSGNAQTALGAVTLQQLEASLGDLGISTGPTAPSDPHMGDLWFDTIASELKVYDGITWQSITSAAGLTSITAGIGLNGGTITSSGIISLQVPVAIENGGTGASTASGALGTLGITDAINNAINAIEIPSSGVQSVTAGTGLTGGTITNTGTIALDRPVSIANGGTGATTRTAALDALAAAAGATSGFLFRDTTGAWTTQGPSASGVQSVTAGAGLTGGIITNTGIIALASPVAVADGGTGATTAAQARTNLGIGTGSGSVTSVIAGTGLTGGTITVSGTIGLSVPVSLANGGTGATTAQQARTNIQAAPTSNPSGGQNNYAPMSGRTSTWAAAGQIGEVIANSSATAIGMFVRYGNPSYYIVQQITITAGDWDIDGAIHWAGLTGLPSGGSIGYANTGIQVGACFNSGALGTAPNRFDTQTVVFLAGTWAVAVVPIRSGVFRVTTNTVISLVSWATALYPQDDLQVLQQVIGYMHARRAG